MNEEELLEILMSNRKTSMDWTKIYNNNTALAHIHETGQLFTITVQEVQLEPAD